ncbi:hypothetical protein MA16_Dca021036 [Dendrobium catenatum]|uniref:Uncharacterized protein n=1 Tax=Dendrobium catenatum TaxID=906689 RepID=A0A2I0W5I2_9ASPA|nr:hypothetical protein MA16_Dca021036 [Dendrobium catenatum]
MRCSRGRAKRSRAATLVGLQMGFRVDPATRRVNPNPIRFLNGSNPGTRTRFRVWSGSGFRVVSNIDTPTTTHPIAGLPPPSSPHLAAGPPHNP